MTAAVSRYAYSSSECSLEATKIEPVIDRVFGFDEARAAYEYMASGKHFGKVVVRVD